MNALDIQRDITVFTKYARYQEHLGRRETYDEVVKRYEQMLVDQYPHLEEKIRRVVGQFVLTQKVLPSMRALQFGGKPIQVAQNRIYNCGYTPVDDPAVFSEAMFLLLGGTGLGYSVQCHHVNKLPPINKPSKSRKFVVGDSIEGWADAVKVLMKAYLTEYDYRPVFDFNDIRPKGARLVTSGGKAPGPAPLKRCLENIETLLNRKEEGSQLSSVEVHDIMCLIADAVLAGGIRRAAMISLFTASDEKMLSAKGIYMCDADATSISVNYDGKNTTHTLTFRVEDPGYGSRWVSRTVKEFDLAMILNGSVGWWVLHPHRARANNSVVLERENTSKEDFFAIWEQVEVNRSGEPGFYWTNDRDWGTNPCQPPFSTVLTPDGIRQFKDIDVGSEIWSEDGWVTVTKKWSTGVKPVYTYRTTAGKFVGTNNHRVVNGGVKVEVKDADGIDVLAGDGGTEVNIDPQDVMDGLVFGDGSRHLTSADKVYLNVGENDNDYFSSEVAALLREPHAVNYGGAWKVVTTITPDEVPHTYERVVPERFLYGSPSKVAGFLRGVYSANGCVVANRVVLKSTSFTVVEQVQQMLSMLGIRSYFTVNKQTWVKHENGTYLSRESYNLNISTDRGLFYRKIGFIQGYKMDKLREAMESITPQNGRKTHDIVDVEYLGDFEVFDITVDGKNHTYWTGGVNVSNCAEISLRPNTFCNLCEINASTITSQSDLNERAAAAAFLGTLQAGFTDFHYLRPVWRERTEEDALIGVGATGIASGQFTRYDLEEAAAIVRSENRVTAYDIGIRPAARQTTVKPSGSASMVLGTSSGIHAWHSLYYIRRMRFAKHEPLYRYLEQKLPELVEDDVTDPDTGILMLPIKAPEGAVIRDEPVSQFLARIADVTKRWIRPGHQQGVNTNNISATISVRENEWEYVGNWLWENRELYNGLSVLPYSDHVYQQAPFTEIDQDTYERLLGYLCHVDLREVVEEEDETQLTAELACAGGGSCDLTY